MPLRLYNSYAKREEEFVPHDPRNVTMYTCGPTVYGRPHIGNYSSFLMADLLRRWLETGHGFHVKHVKNITDVGHLLQDADSGDDKVQQQAEKEKVHPLEIARRYEAEYLEDERTLNMLEPAARPRASEFIKEQLAMVKVLLQNGHAYETDDGIYFAVQTFPSYGSLSGNVLENLDAGSRVDVKEAKKHPADFAVWKKCIGENAKHILRWSFETGEVASSIGDDPTTGFPGWHIECSAMSRSLLGDQIDLHTGGEDNIFPHHECEIAQSECVTGKKPFVRLWLHKRRIALGEQKMSKSLGNVKNIPDITAMGYSPMDLRYYLLSVHYRTQLRFTPEGLDEAHGVRRSIMEWMEHEGRGVYAAINNFPKEPKVDEIKKFEEEFRAAMDSDLNVSAAIASVFNCIGYMNSRSQPAMEEQKVLKDFIHVIRETFGCFNPEEESIPQDVLDLARQRDEARAQKDFAKSDVLRDQLQAMGYEVRDSKEGTKVKKL